MHYENQRSDYSQKWITLAAVGMGVFLATVDGSIVNVALPTLVRTFDTQFALVQWVALAYMLTIATLILSMGRLGDMTGKKKIYLYGMITFTLGSAMCGLAPSIYWLIAARIFQGVGAAMMASLGAALITEAFPREERGKAMGMVGGIVSVGIIAGPAIGGILIDAISWHWIFFVNLPVGAVGVCLVIRNVPETKPRPDQKFDFKGAVFLFISVLSFLLALTAGQRLGFGNTFIISLFGIWLIFFLFFLFTELRLEQPMVDLKLFRNTLFSINLMTGFLAFVSSAGIVLLMPFYLENVLRYNPHQVGILLATVPLSAGFTSPLSGWLSDRWGTRPMAALGLFVIFIGYFGLTTLSAETSAFGYILRFIPVGLGIGIFQSPNNSAIMGAAPKMQLGVVSGLLSITRTLGQTTGIATLGAFWAARTIYYTAIDNPPHSADHLRTAQVQALHDTIICIEIVIGLALLLSVWGIILEWTKKRGNCQSNKARGFNPQE